MLAILTGRSQVLVQQRKNGNANHRHRDGDLQGLERDTEQQQCPNPEPTIVRTIAGSSRLRLRSP